MTAASDSALIHAVAIAVAVDADGPLAGALILGPSGAGKSSLALSIIEACPFQRTALVADDAVLIEADNAFLRARSPDRIKGLIEIRGYGPAPVRTAPAIHLIAAIDLGGAAERAPAPKEFRPLGNALGLPLYPFFWRGGEATAAHRLRRMIVSILDGQMPQRTQDSAPVQRD